MHLARYIRSGALAGAVSAFIFLIVHDLFISDIWFSSIPMIAAGALCGLCVAWTYGLTFEAPSAWSWLRYNLVYIGMYVALGVASVLLFEPITTAAEVIAANKSPSELFGRAMPMTAAFTLLSAGVLSVFYGRKWLHFAAILLTCIVLVSLLGLNVSVLGLVSIPGGAAYLVVEMFILIVLLNMVYAGVFVGLERHNLLPQRAVYS